jgi:hypothetical protein
MNMALSAIALGPQMNLALAWLWISLGFLSGLALGTGFHREDWLGGYASLRRRLYRLAHISFFGLGFVNLAFYFTARVLLRPGPVAGLASGSFVLGALLMPLCCLLTAHFPRTRWLFALPVVSLLVGGALTMFMLLQRGPTLLTSGL